MVQRFMLLCCAVCLAVGSCCDPDTALHSQSQFWVAGMEYDDAAAPVRLSVAAVCLRVDPVPAVNRARMTGFVDDIVAAHPDVRLIVFGETSLGFYYRPSAPEAYQRSVAETVPGPTTDALAVQAAAHGIHISFGLTEEAAGRLHNSQVLLGPDGAIVSVHRKTHLTEWDVENGFQPGSSVAFNTIDGVRTATVICFDALSATVLRELAAGSPGIVILSQADRGSGIDFPADPVALSCNAWVIAANRVGNEDGNAYAGRYSITTPIGSSRAEGSGGEGYLYANIGVWP